ncbi:hypothetical protein N9L47_02795 [Rhodobacteraceae bacterium]|nr:hypothetical protein [Paracoccaceae bacterium]
MIRAAAFALALVFAFSAQAQDANCNAQWARLSDLLIKAGAIDAALPGLIRETANGGCRINGVALPSWDNLDVKAQSLSWRGRDLDRFAREGLPPTALSLSIKGITLVPNIGDPVFSYIQSIQARGKSIDVALSYRWDEAAKVLELQSLRFDFPQDDYLELQARVDRVDLTNLGTMQVSVGGFAVTDTSLVIRSERMFQDYVLTALGSVVLRGSSDSAGRVAALKVIGSEAVMRAPNDVLNSASKTALNGLIDQMPDPKGQLVIETSSRTGIGPARFLPLVLPYVFGSVWFDGLDDVWQLLDGVDTTITYDKF